MSDTNTQPPRPRILLKTKSEIEQWLTSFFVKRENYFIHDDLTVDILGTTSVSLMRRELEYLPINFGKFEGTLDLRENNIWTLEGSPKEIEGSFNCLYNKLTSLKGAPKRVGGSFNCARNKLTSLEFGPEVVKRHYLASYNCLTTLKGIPKEIMTLDISTNLLKSLEYGPEKVERELTVGNNPLTTVQYMPKFIGNALYLDSVESLRDLFELRTVFLPQAEISLSPKYAPLLPGAQSDVLGIIISYEEFKVVQEKYQISKNLDFLPMSLENTTFKPHKI